MSSEGIKEFKVNDYITLKLEDGKTIIYVKGKRFDQCKYLLLNIYSRRYVKKVCFLKKLSVKLSNYPHSVKRNIRMLTIKLMLLYSYNIKFSISFFSRKILLLYLLRQY